MSKNEMGNRGSKSVIHSTKQSSIIVKEQRVNGSWCGINLPRLRYTLLGFERSYQVKILSNQIIQRQLYSTVSNLDNSSKLPLDPWFISGFSDAEGCFLVLIRKSPKNLLGWQLEVNFTINLHARDLDLLKLIKAYFGVGRIALRAPTRGALGCFAGKERNGCCDFTIGSLDQIITKVIPHFCAKQKISSKN